MMATHRRRICRYSSQSVACIALVFTSASLAADIRTLRLGEDTFVVGDEVTLQRTVAGDAVVAAGEVVLNASVGGDAVVAGGDVEVTGHVDDDLYAAGGQVRIGAQIDESARVAGGDVHLLPGAKIGQGLSAAGGRIVLDGDVAGYAQLTGGSMRIDGHVDGDVYAVGGELHIGPKAVIDGAITYRGPQAVDIAPGATVNGPVRNIVLDRAELQRRWLWTLGAIVLVWFIGWAIVGAVLLGLFPDATRRVTALARSRTGLAMLLGLVAVLVLPPLMLLLFGSVVGIPLALLVLLLYLALLPLGFLAGVATTGDWLMQRRPQAAPPRTRSRILVFVLTLLVVMILTQIPFIGWLAGVLLWLLGIGAIVLAVARARPVGQLAAA